MRSAVMLGPIVAKIGFAGSPEDYELLLCFAVA
jgi:hypothetical protein